MGLRISLMVGKCICFFPYDGKIYMTVAFLFWVVHLTKRTGGLFHNQLFWNSVLALFAQFSITGCKVFFHQVLVLKHLFTVGPRISLMVGKYICFFPYVGKFAFLWPFLTLFFIVFLLWIFFPGLSLV